MHEASQEREAGEDAKAAPDKAGIQRKRFENRAGKAYEGCEGKACLFKDEWSEESSAGSKQNQASSKKPASAKQEDADESLIIPAVHWGRRRRPQLRAGSLSAEIRVTFF